MSDISNIPVYHKRCENPAPHGAHDFCPGYIPGRCGCGGCQNRAPGWTLYHINIEEADLCFECRPRSVYT